MAYQRLIIEYHLVNIASIGHGHEQAMPIFIKDKNMWTYINLITAVLALIGFIWAMRNMWKATTAIQRLHTKWYTQAWINEDIKNISEDIKNKVYHTLIESYDKEFRQNRKYALIQLVCFVISSTLFFKGL